MQLKGKNDGLPYFVEDKGMPIQSYQQMDPDLTITRSGTLHTRKKRKCQNTFSERAENVNTKQPSSNMQVYTQNNSTSLRIHDITDKNVGDRASFSNMNAALSPNNIQRRIRAQVIVTTSPNTTRHRRYKALQLQWDYSNPCQYCHYICLKGATAGQKSKCCINGAALRELFPQLHFLPP